MSTVTVTDVEPYGPNDDRITFEGDLDDDETVVRFTLDRTTAAPVIKAIWRGRAPEVEVQDHQIVTRT